MNNFNMPVLGLGMSRASVSEFILTLDIHGMVSFCLRPVATGPCPPARTGSGGGAPYTTAGNCVHPKKYL